MKRYITTVMLGLLGCLSLVDACKEFECASKVSKCMLLQSCPCDPGNATASLCLKGCTKCLGKMYMECCACVGLCKPKDREDATDHSSTVEELKEPIPDLFNVLTEEEDEYRRWTSYTYPAMAAKPGKNILLIRGLHERRKPTDLEDANCTVAFMSQCSAMQKCKDACKSMGASQYRWFHDNGCCQCVGHTCLNYGLNKPKCSKCPSQDEMDELEQEENFIQSMDTMNEKVVEMEEDVEINENNDEEDESDDEDDEM